MRLAPTHQFEFVRKDLPALTCILPSRAFELALNEPFDARRLLELEQVGLLDEFEFAHHPVYCQRRR